MRYIILLLFCMPVYADSFQIHLESKHANGCETCNEKNYGIGWRGEGQIAPTLGYYENSWFKDSFYAGLSFNVISGVHVTTAVVSGYQGATNTTNGELLPLVMGHWVILPNSRISPMISYAPTQDGGVTLLSINIKR